MISVSVDVTPKSNSDRHSSYWPPGGDSCDNNKKTNKKPPKTNSSPEEVWEKLALKHDLR